MLQETLQSARLQKPMLENSIWYNGHRFSFLLDATQTARTFVLIHCYFRKGGEPPAHYHTREDETFYILEGEIRFHIGDKKFTAKAGELAFAPREIPHQFSLVTETAKALLLISPAGIETFFKEFSVPAQSLELPPIPEGQPPAEFFDNMMKRAIELGIVWMPEF
jgi:quercetin dioxygenase-like cupin family protein